MVRDFLTLVKRAPDLDDSTSPEEIQDQKAPSGDQRRRAVRLAASASRTGGKPNIRP